MLRELLGKIQHKSKNLVISVPSTRELFREKVTDVYEGFLQRHATGVILGDSTLGVIVELAHNSMRHAHNYDPRKEVTLSCYIGEDKTLVGCRDEGTFYANPVVLGALREGTGFPPSSKVEGGGEGLQRISRNGREFEYDSSSNTFYVLLTKEHLVTPSRLPEVHD